VDTDDPRTVERWSIPGIVGDSINPAAEWKRKTACEAVVYFDVESPCLTLIAGGPPGGLAVIRPYVLTLGNSWARLSRSKHLPSILNRLLRGVLSIAEIRASFTRVCNPARQIDSGSTVSEIRVVAVSLLALRSAFYGQQGSNCGSFRNPANAFAALL
jgi:hypothetical protein